MPLAIVSQNSAACAPTPSARFGKRSLACIQDESPIALLEIYGVVSYRNPSNERQSWKAAEPIQKAGDAFYISRYGIIADEHIQECTGGLFILNCVYDYCARGLKSERKQPILKGSKA